MTFPSLRSPCSLLVALTLLAIAPSSLQAQASGSVVIVVEGSLTLSTPPAAAPVAPTVVVDAPVAPAVLAPTPMILAPSAAYVPPAQSLTVAPPEAPRVRRRWGLVGAGAGMALGAYALNIGGTVLALTWPFSNGHRDPLFYSSFVPVAGPLMQIAFRDADWQIPFYVVSSALQIAGFVMAFVGTFTPSTESPTSASVTVLPYASSDGLGVMAGGRF